MITTWYLHSHLTWDRLCQSCIGSSFLPHGAFLEEGAYAISRRVHHVPLKALRVTRPEAVGLARTKPSASWQNARPLRNSATLGLSAAAFWNQATAARNSAS